MRPLRTILAAAALLGIASCAHAPRRQAIPIEQALRAAIQQIGSKADLRAYDRAVKSSSDSIRTFFERFWERMDPTPGTPANEYALRFNARLQQATEELQPIPGLGPDDRLAAWALCGRPDRVEVRLDRTGAPPMPGTSDSGPAWVWWRYIPDEKVDLAGRADPLLSRLEYSMQFVRDENGYHHLRGARDYPYYRSFPNLSGGQRGHLIALLEDPGTDAYLAAAALWRLRADPSPEALAAILGVADHPDPVLREAAADAIDPLVNVVPAGQGRARWLPLPPAERTPLLGEDGQPRPRVVTTPEPVRAARLIEDPALLANLLIEVHDPADHLSVQKSQRLRALAASADSVASGTGWLSSEAAATLFTGPLRTARDLIETGSYQQAHDFLEPLLRAGLAEEAEAWHLDAIALLETTEPGGRQLAEEQIREALRLDPGNVRYRLLLARIYSRRTLERYADQALDRVIEETPAAADAYALKGVIRMQTYWAAGWKAGGWATAINERNARPQVMHAEAVDYLEQALVLDPDNKLASWWLGYDALAGEDWVRAIPIMSRLIRFKVHTAEALLGRAMALQSLGRLQMAAGDYEEGLRILSDEMRAVADDPRWSLPIPAGGFGLSSQGLQVGSSKVHEQIAATRAGPDTSGLLSDRDRYWRSRNPLFSAPVNERLIEQYRRFAYVTWNFALPDLGLRGWETQRGQIYMRYGEPLRATDLTAELRAKMDPKLVAREDEATPERSLADEAKRRWEGSKGRWIYEDMVFNFGSGQVTGNLILMPPVLDEPWVIGTRGAFERLTETTPVRDRVVGGTVVLPLEADWYAFLSPSHAVELIAAARFPRLARPSGRGGVERSAHPLYLIALDDAWEEIDRDVLEVPARDLLYASPSSWVAPPLVLRTGEDTAAPAHAAIELVAADGDTAYTGRSDLPVLGGEGLRMSSLVLASNVTGVDRAAAWPERAWFQRGDRAVVPRPGRDFSLGEPLLLYFEAYGLTKDEINATSYRVVFSTTALDEGSGIPAVEVLGRVLGREEQEGTVRIVTEREGIRSDIQESIRLVFPAGIDSSRYQVTITIEDRVSGASVERTIELHRR